jgi:hypothetical protein
VTDDTKPADCTGTLMRDSGGFVLKIEGKELVRLLLHRVPVDLVEKPARVIGIWLDDHTIEAEGVATL